MNVFCDVIIFIVAVFSLLYYGIKAIVNKLSPGTSKGKLKKYCCPGGDYYELYNNMVNANSHILIAGATGSGKSVIINGILETIIKLHCPGAKNQRGVDLILCDPKKVELSRYSQLPHVIKYSDTLTDITSALRLGHEIMMRRYEDMKKRGETLTPEGPVFIFIDEYADFILDKQEVSAADKNILYSIGRMGRAAKVFLIVATQTPNRDVITKMIDANFNYRVGLHCNKDIESRQIIGFNYCTSLPKYGECYIVEPGELPRHVKNVPMYSEREIKETINDYSIERQKVLQEEYQQRHKS